MPCPTPHPLALPETRINPETFVHTLVACQKAIETRFENPTIRTEEHLRTVNQEYDKLISLLAHYILDRQNQDQPVPPKELDYFHEEIDAYINFLLENNYKKMPFDEFFRLHEQLRYERTRKYLLEHNDIRGLFLHALQTAHQKHSEQQQSNALPRIFSIIDTANRPVYAMKMIQWNMTQGETADPALLLPPTPPHISLDGRYIREILELVKKLYGEDTYSHYSHWVRNGLDPLMRLGYHDNIDQYRSTLTRIFAEIEAEIVAEHEQKLTAEAARTASTPDSNK